LRQTLAVAMLVALAGVGGACFHHKAPAAASTQPVTTVQVTAPKGAPASTVAFTPPPPLGAEPSADDSRPGGAYLEAIHAQIHPLWAQNFLESLRLQLPPDNQLNRPALYVVVDMAIAADGTLHDVLLQHPTGFNPFDQAAVQIVRDASPYPKPPADLASDDGYVHVTWTLARDVRQCSPADAQVVVEEAPLAQAVKLLVQRGDVVEAGQRIIKEAPAGQQVDAASLFARVLLRQALVDPDPKIRAAACTAVGASGDASALDEIATNLGDENASVRQAAALAVAALAGPTDATGPGPSPSSAAPAPAAPASPASAAATGPALQKLLTDANAGVVQAAVVALAALGQSPAATAALGDGLSSSDPGVQAQAATELTGSGDPALAAPLAAILGGKDASPKAVAARAAAATALGSLPTADATHPLMHALTDPNADVRAAAARALGKLKSPGKGPYYALLDLFKDPSAEVRAAVAAAAVRIGGADAVGELYAIVKDPDPGVGSSIAGALAGVPGPDALQILRDELASKNAVVREAAAASLAARADGVDILAGLLKDADPLVRAVAVAQAADQSTAVQILGGTSVGEPIMAASFQALARLHALPAGTAAAIQALAAASRADQVGLAGAWLEAAAPR
jgi:TonB family protein